MAGLGVRYPAQTTALMPRQDMNIWMWKVIFHFFLEMSGQQAASLGGIVICQAVE